MNRKSTAIFALSVLLLSCSEDNENSFPSSFEVSVDNTGYDFASISWEPLGESTTYDVILSDQEIASSITDNTFEFSDLEIQKSYSGRIIATNSNSQRSIGTFEFSTGSFDLDLNVKKYTFDLNITGANIWLQFGWNQVPNEISSDISYRLLINGTNIWQGTRPDSETGRYSHSHKRGLFKENEEVRITVLAEYANGSIRDEIIVNTPNSSDIPEFGFELEKSYEGYTAFAFQLENISFPAQYFVDKNDRTVEWVDFDDEQIHITDWPLTVVPDYDHPNGGELNVREILNDSVVCEKRIAFRPELIYRLPDEDLSVNVYNVRDQSFEVLARNTTSIEHYDPSLNGPTRFKLYLNDDFRGNYGCYFISNHSNGGFPTVGDLDPNTEYTLKVEVDYGNFIPDPSYEELEVPLTTFKEVRVMTDSVSINSVLDIYTINVSNNSFDLVWKTDLSYDQSCDNPLGTAHYEFTLWVDDVEFESFLQDQRQITVDGLEPNTLYNVTLNCDLTNRFFGGTFETRSASVTVTTRE